MNPSPAASCRSCCWSRSPSWRWPCSSVTSAGWKVSCWWRLIAVNVRSWRAARREQAYAEEVRTKVATVEAIDPAATEPSRRIWLDLLGIALGWPA